MFKAKKLCANYDFHIRECDMAVRRCVVVLGDQLDAAAMALGDFDPAMDLVWMAEAMGESTYVPSSKQRTALFLSAMRHFARDLRAKGWPVQYRRVDEAQACAGLADALRRDLQALQPEEVVVTAPGEWRVLDLLKLVTHETGIPLRLLDDAHFFTTVRDFARHAQGRKQLRMEFWYRELRKRFDVLMDGDQPVGGQWNFDADNRESFGKKGPQDLPDLPRFEPDEITQEVIDWVRSQPKLPGEINDFNWPVTRVQALVALDDFVTHRLKLFGRYEDAMWTGEPWLYHSLLSAALNLKLLSAREVVAAAEAAYRAGQVELASAEGFIRQILGWREYVRGVYWTRMPEYVNLNAMDAQMPLPHVFWTADTQMACVREVVGQTLRLGYAHHIQRLMVTGLYALLLGVRPQEVHAWYLGVYVDAVEWVELPNTLGMSQYADGGIMASKPYVASGKYIDRMSNYCKGCAFKPQDSVGEQACPITTLYWDFLIRHQEELERNPRMVMQVRNAKRLTDETRAQIQAQAQMHRASV
jgi:deoxyribodipyrimidine photolyase-related protein